MSSYQAGDSNSLNSSPWTVKISKSDALGGLFLESTSIP